MQSADDGVPDIPIKVGTLASQFRLTVRTLHHYDNIGLLSPSARTQAGHRMYSRQDIVRLDRIQFLRFLGLSLAEIAPLLDDAQFSALTVIDRQIDRLTEEVTIQQQLITQLRSMATALRDGTPTARGHLMDLIPDDGHAIQSLANHVVVDPVLDGWAAILDQVRQHMMLGTPADDPELHHLAVQWRTLMHARAYGFPVASARMAPDGSRVREQAHEDHATPSFAPEVYEYLATVLAAVPTDVPDGRRNSEMPRRRNDTRPGR